MTGLSAGTWRIRAGEHAFGGVMGLLGKFGATGAYTVTGWTGTYNGVSSWNMIQALGRPLFNTLIGYGATGTPLYQNPFTKTDRWYKTTPKGQVKVNTVTAVGSGTPWTTGALTLYAREGDYTTVLHRTGYDNRNASGIGRIQLVTPALTHWSGRGSLGHTGHIGILTIQVPEPAEVLFLAAGIGALLGLRAVGRRR